MRVLELSLSLGLMACTSAASDPGLQRELARTLGDPHPQLRRTSENSWLICGEAASKDANEKGLGFRAFVFLRRSNGLLLEGTPDVNSDPGKFAGLLRQCPFGGVRLARSFSERHPTADY
jgi:hypothetical protein